MYSIVQWYCALELTSVLLLMPWLYAVICSRNWVPRPGSKIPYLVPNPGNYYLDFHHDRTKYHQFWPVFASVNDVKRHCSSNCTFNFTFTNLIVRLLIALTHSISGCFLPRTAHCSVKLWSLTADYDTVTSVIVVRLFCCCLLTTARTWRED